MRIGKSQARQILEDHGFTLEEFQSEEGARNEYKLMDVLGWLGYCCPSC